MPITVRYPGDIRALGRTAQFAGEGAYITQQLNPLATSDENRRVSTQLTLLDLVEGARRANLQAQVSRSNTLDQIRSSQAQARFGRQSSERMALFGAAQGRQQQQASSLMNAQVAAANFRRQQSLGQDRFGQQLEIGEQGFGFGQQLQEQQDQALDIRQQAEMRQREISGIMQTLEPQAQGQIRSINFQRQRFMDDQRKRPILREDEFQQQLQTFDQRIDEVLQVASQQPSLDEQFQQRGQWIKDPNSPGLRHYIGIDPKSGKLHKVIEGDQQMQQGTPVFSASDWNNYHNNRAKAKQFYRSQVTAGENGKSVPVFSEQEIEQFIDRDYPPLPGMQGLNSAGFDARYGDAYNAQQASSRTVPTAQGGARQFAPQQPAAEQSIRILQQLEQSAPNTPVSAAAREVRGILQEYGFNPTSWPVEVMRRYRREFAKIENLLLGQQ